jgi:glycerate 2-kinase
MWNFNMKILIAPNAFKSSLNASEAAEAIRLGLSQSGFPCILQSFPIGDGGDGTGELMINCLKGKIVDSIATDPLGRQIKTTIGLCEGGKIAVIEMANISGLKLLREEELDPLHASSFGTGELILHALNEGASTIILCIGGTATTDGGCGILRAIGLRFYDKTKKELLNLPEDLVYLDAIDLSGIDKRIHETKFIILCDVDNFLLGENGASEVFGPQKGATAADIIQLEMALEKLREVALRQTGKDMNSIQHGGAAGGTAAGLQVFLKAKLVQGIEYFLDMTGFDTALRGTDLLITGEGSIDLQTLNGKGPYGVARRAKQMGIPVIGMAGSVPLEKNSHLDVYFDVIMAIGHQPTDLKTAIPQTCENLIRTSFQLGKLLAISKKMHG